MGSSRKIEFSKEDTILLSIKPKYCDLIRKKIKKIELRKRAPKKHSKTILIYESAPTKKISFAIKIKEIHCDSPEKIWKKFGNQTGITRKEFREYFRGKKEGYAYEVQEVIKLKTTIHLKELIELGVTPPQDYLYAPKRITEKIKR